MRRSVVIGDGDEVVNEERHEQQQHGHDDELGVLLPEAGFLLLGAWPPSPLTTALQLALELLVLGLLSTLVLLATRTLRLLFLLKQKATVSRAGGQQQTRGANRCSSYKCYCF